jgi:hypothetical protein
VFSVYQEEEIKHAGFGKNAMAANDTEHNEHFDQPGEKAPTIYRVRAAKKVREIRTRPKAKKRTRTVIKFLRAK